MLQLDEKGTDAVQIFVDSLANLDGSIPCSYTLADAEPPHRAIGHVDFQNTHTEELNGCQLEDIFIVLMDRIKYLQCSSRNCEEYDAVQMYLQLGLRQLRTRAKK